MKPGGGSGLNPNAAAYVPLSKREGDPAKPVAAAVSATTHHVQHQPYGYGVQGKGHVMDDEMEMEFLLASFSGLSDESIRDVYLANNGDLDATMDMLTQLEIFSNEAEDYLPDTLDIGDVPETVETSTSSAPPKQKSASNEASGSSSGTPNNAPVSSS
ncbi:hypothetical protein HA466_0122680 [Hirschfeldia incana]|nr:hypothetical protein HA466_0122680 [Hirschfeldia incana]KAJ0253202.1 hypothetical protein HA466_0122680 [Hirschfeldia incana]KAJ0253203.1 hypothetical protein HA466_0122680 [Hirschfeldia incana]KAJ0253204.1 hypothetical protein HA466_0122680 [Hirschfeldia incana]